MLKIAYVSTWPPRKCGIASFAYDLAWSINNVSKEINWKVIAITPNKNDYHYPKEVIYRIDQKNADQYRKAANFVNQSHFDLIVIQHEFKIYGGELGENIFNFLQRIKKPAIGIMHTIPDPKDKSYKKKEKIDVIKKMHPYFVKLVTTCKTGKKRLKEVYGIPPSKIYIIPHGSISFPKISSKEAKIKLKMADSSIILAFGFIEPRKDYETLIRAFPKVLAKYPNVQLVLLGGGHRASVICQNYLTSLKKLVQNYNMENKVLISNKFAPQSLVKNYYNAADVFVCTNSFKSQISSGPLTYALAAGKAIVSTNFDFAKDLLKKDRGILIPIGNSEALARAILKILDNPKLKLRLERNSAAFGNELTWDKIGLRYLKLFQQVARGNKSQRS